MTATSLDTPTYVVKMNGHRGDTEWLADVAYVGRSCGMGGWRLPKHPLANPFRVQEYGGAERAAAMYRHWLARKPDLLALIPALRGKRLGCWCLDENPNRIDRSVLVCHAQWIAELADGRGWTR